MHRHQDREAWARRPDGLRITPKTTASDPPTIVRRLCANGMGIAYRPQHVGVGGDLVASGSGARPRAPIIVGDLVVHGFGERLGDALRLEPAKPGQQLVQARPLNRTGGHPPIVSIELGN
jgi:hypothetical protein